VAWCLSRFPVEEQVRAFSFVPPESSARIFEEMDLLHQVEILKLGRLPVLSTLLRHLDSDEIADVLGALDPVEKEKWLATLPDQELKEAQSLLAYPPDTAGGLMAKEYLTVPISLSAGEVASRLQALASNFEKMRVTYVYVVDDRGGLKGVLPLRDLIFRTRETPIESFMVKNVTTIPDTASKRDVAELFRQRNLLALPVVTGDAKLVGIITADDVIDVIQELANEEMLKLSGVSTEETRDAPLFSIVRRRLSWLSINIVLDLISASVITLFQNTLQAVIALAFFLPIISDMSGCSGMQAVAVSIRDLALQKIVPSEYYRVLRKELAIGFLNGAVLGALLGLVALLLKGIPMLGLVVALALWINSLIAVGFGGLIPLAIKHLKFDPAIASGPILTTITDMIGFFILLGLATVWLPWLTPK
jgi:magnesium transporter